MKTLAILSQKGGTGKTTLAINLSVAAARELDCPVTLIDLDPQASAASWSDSREDTSPAVISAQANRLPQLIAAAKASCAVGKATANASPAVEKTTPWFVAIASRMTASWRARATDIPVD